MSLQDRSHLVHRDTCFVICLLVGINLRRSCLGRAAGAGSRLTAPCRAEKPYHHQGEKTPGLFAHGQTPVAHLNQMSVIEIGAERIALRVIRRDCRLVLVDVGRSTKPLSIDGKRFGQGRGLAKHSRLGKSKEPEASVGVLATSSREQPGIPGSLFVLVESAWPVSSPLPGKR